jgi:hypothetical protein
MKSLKQETQILEQVITYSNQIRDMRKKGTLDEELAVAIRYFSMNKNEDIMKDDKNYIAFKEKVLKDSAFASSNESLLYVIIDRVTTELDMFIWKTDKNGDKIYDDKGNPKVDWIKVIFNVGKLVGGFMAIKETYDKSVR